MKKVYFLVLSIFLLIGVSIAIAFAWFTNTEFVEPELSGYSISAYFGGGDGSAESPYQIKNPRHLYNLAWLQYLGYFNKPGEGNEPDDKNTTYLTHYSFVINDNLNMTGWPLPPIGTSLYPFIGSLNGNGHTISNLTTTNRFEDFENDEIGVKHPSTITSETYTDAEIIGFVGAIGKLDETMDEDTKDLALSGAPSLTNLVIANSSVKSVTDNVLIGSVAGYVNGLISNVGVKDAALKVNSTAVVQSIQNKVHNLSDYSVVGYAEDAYTTAKTKNDTTIFNPTTTYDHFTYYGMGNTDNWGGSLNMSSLYTRINSKINNTVLQDYVTKEINYYDANGNIIESKTRQTKETNPTYTFTYNINNYTSSSATEHFYYVADGANGSYLTKNQAPNVQSYSGRNGTGNITYGGYDYLTAFYKDVIAVKINGTTNGFKIKNYSNNYLNIKSNEVDETTFTTEITSGTNASNATIWAYEESGDEYTLWTYNENDGNRFYLATTDYSNLNLSSTSFIWKYESNEGFYVENNSKKYYLRFVNGNWIVTTQRSYVLTDNNGHYLARNSTTGNGGVKNVNTVAEATRWIFENEDTKSGIIYDESATNYRLCIYNNTLSVRSNATTSWTNDTSSNKLYNGSNFIIFNGTNWVLYQPNQYYIKYGNNYLSIDNNGNILNDVTDSSVATLWTFGDISTNPKGYISVTTNNGTYYLRNNNGTLSTTTSTNNRTSWSNTGDGLYNGNYYIQYANNQWILKEKPVIRYKISYDGTYLNATTSGVSGGTNLNNATIWYLDETNNRIYFLNNTTKYYFYYYSWGQSTLSVTPSTNQDYYPSKTENYLKTGNYYITYNGKKWTDTSTATGLTFLDLTEESYIPDLILNNNYVTATSLIRLNMSVDESVATIYKREVKKEVPSVYNYIPINTDDNNVVKDTNTGYIMSGGHSGDSGSLSNVDIRVAGEATAYNSSRISSSYNATTNKITTVYTYDGNGLHGIDENTQTYQKYTASKESMQTTLSQHESAIGGIHFIEALISKNRLITAPSVLINGKTYTDYQMPEDSIDFNLKSKGYINFFATLYYPGSTTFFSLYDIKRNSDNTIKSINHIKEIYQNDADKSQDYVYVYEDGTYSNGASSLSYDYRKIFDTSWIETPTFTDDQFDDTASNPSSYRNNGRFMKKLFYFEIPINAGEYALGSVEGRDGGYLLYLDIGANAASVDRTVVTQKSTSSQADYKYVNGIQIIDTNFDTDSAFDISSTAFDASNSAVATIPTSSTVIGNITISRTGNNIAFNSSLNSTYLGTGITSDNLTLTPLTTPTTVTGNVLKYYDYNKAIDTLYVTTVTNDGSSNTGYTVYKVLSNGTKELIADQSTQDTMSKEYGLLKINDTGGGEAVALNNVSFVTGSTVELDYDFYVNTADKSKVATTIEMKIESVPTDASTIITNEETFNGTVPATITFTSEGKLVVGDYVIEKAYMFTGNTITVTLDATTQVLIYINESKNYTFIINTKNATTSSTDIYTVKPS